MMIRSTTNGVLKSYRYNLQRSSYTLNKAMNTVLTGRNFDTYAADPATAARCFQMRRSFQRANSQYSVSESVVRKYDQAWMTSTTKRPPLPIRTFLTVSTIPPPPAAMPWGSL